MEKTLSTKEIVLRSLQAGGFVSGENLAEIAGVSRTAIWKAVRSLRNEGYTIDAITNKGYKISEKNDVMCDRSISEALSLYFKSDAPVVRYFETIDSTNNELKRMAASCGAIRNCFKELTAEGSKCHKVAVVAESQSAGRGRLGRSFYSPYKSGIYMSLLFAPRNGVTEPARLTASAAVAICRALSSLYGMDAKIKWVNDIFVGGKKVCGILTEGVTNFESGTIEAAIVGIGINIYDGDGFPAEIANVAGSLLGKELDGKFVPRSVLVACILSNLLEIYEAEDRGDEEVLEKAMEEYRSRSLLKGKTVTVIPVIDDESTSYNAVVVDVDNQVGLVVRLEDGSEKVLKSGEISLGSVNFSDHCDM